MNMADLEAELNEAAAIVQRQGERSAVRQVNEAFAAIGSKQTIPDISIADAKTALYRHFNKAGRLLYVGISLHAALRLMGHRSHAPWYYEIARIEIEWLPNRRQAEAAELQAIKTERPLHNVRHNGLKLTMRLAEKIGRASGP